MSVVESRQLLLANESCEVFAFSTAWCASRVEMLFARAPVGQGHRHQQTVCLRVAICPASSSFLSRPLASQLQLLRVASLVDDGESV